MSNVTALSEARPPMVSGGQINAIIPQSMDDAYHLANVICKAGMAHKGLETPE